MRDWAYLYGRDPGRSMEEEISPPSLLEDRQGVVRHLQDDAGPGRAGMAADLIEPRAVGVLPRQQFVPDGRIPLRPVRPAGRPHGLHGVIVAVEVVHVRPAQTA